MSNLGQILSEVLGTDEEYLDITELTELIQGHHIQAPDDCDPGTLDQLITEFGN